MESYADEIDDDDDDAAEIIQCHLDVIDEEMAEIESQLQTLCERQDQLKNQKELLLKQMESKTAAIARSKVSKDDFNGFHFQWSHKLQEKLSSVFHIKELRPFQLPTINATMGGHDCILIMPTGGGKSLCFQLPALLTKGVTLVVSPLISLMEDQVMSLKALGVDARMISSGTPAKEQTEILKAMVEPESSLVILYVTPERLSKSKRFMTKLQKMYEMGRFARLAVDEVHCCSQWGHDFRRDYKILGVIKRQFSKVPILGLTATATSRVTADVQEMLCIQGCLVFRASFNRPNLIYKVYPKPRSHNEVMDDLASIISQSYSGQTGIVYCYSTKEAEEVATGLQKKGVTAQPYHANLDLNYRTKIHKDWLSGKVKVVVATVAFGMGIDKPDVRFVIHHSISRSTENFYQESGRAGRDDKPADCVILFRFGDIFRQSCSAFTETSGLKNFYGMIAFCIELKRCRRSILADHFGERWDSKACDKKCDNCDPLLSRGGSKSKDTKLIDVSKYCKDLYRILDYATDIKQRLTGLKLMDAWFGKGAPNLRIPDVNTPSHPRLECERIFIFLLLQNYFEEDFHFTSHATISYIKKGRRAALLSKKDITIMMDVVRNPSSKMRSSSSTLQTNSKSSATSCKGFKTSQSKRPKPCIVNSESSKFGKSSTNSHKPSTPVSNKELPEVNDGIRLDSSDIEQDQDENFIFDDSDSSIEFQGIYGPTKTPKRLKLNSGFESD